MDPDQIKTLGSICIVFFGLCCLIWLADMLGWVTIRSDKQRNYLNVAIGGTLLGAIVSFVGSGVLVRPDGDSEDPLESPSELSSASPTSTSPPSLPTGATSEPGPTETEPKAPSSIDSGKEEDAMITTVSCTRAHPDEIRDWAEETLGPRPDFRCVSAVGYPPSCVSTIRLGDRSTTSLLDAQQCAREIGEFRSAEGIDEIYRLKRPYQSKIAEAELELRYRSTEEEELRWDYINRELLRLNGSAWEAFSTIDSRSWRDQRLCENRRQRCFPDS